MQSSGLASTVQLRNMLTPKMTDWEVGCGRIKLWAIPEPDYHSVNFETDRHKRHQVRARKLNFKMAAM